MCAPTKSITPLRHPYFEPSKCSNGKLQTILYPPTLLQSLDIVLEGREAHVHPMHPYLGKKKMPLPQWRNIYAKIPMSTSITYLSFRIEQ